MGVVRKFLKPILLYISGLVFGWGWGVSLWGCGYPLFDMVLQSFSASTCHGAR
jgi:hypothetical protein